MFVHLLLLNYSSEHQQTLVDYGEPCGNPAPLVKDARRAIVVAFSFHFLFLFSRQAAILSSYHLWLLAPSIYACCNLIGSQHR